MLLRGVFVAGVALCAFTTIHGSSCNTTCLGYENCDAARASDIYGGDVGMSCLHLEDWHCCDCGGCSSCDCEECAQYTHNTTCFDIYAQYGLDCTNCGCDCVLENEQQCEAAWSEWGECQGVCDNTGFRLRNWQITKQSVSMGTTQAYFEDDWECCIDGTGISDVSQSCGQDQQDVPDACTMPACPTTQPPIVTTKVTTTTADATDVCTTLEETIFVPTTSGTNGVVNGQDLSWQAGVAVPYASNNGVGGQLTLVNLMYCEQLANASLLIDESGIPIISQHVYECGCICQNQCTFETTSGIEFDTSCTLRFECLHPCDYIPAETSDTRLETAAGTVVSCNTFQSVSIDEYVAGLGFVDAEATAMAQVLLAEGKFGCEFQAQSSNPTLRQCQQFTELATGNLAAPCGCTNYNTTTTTTTIKTTTTTTPANCARDLNETNACYDLMETFPDLENQCYFFLTHYDRFGELGSGIDCRDCGCTSQCLTTSTTVTATTAAAITTTATATTTAIVTTTTPTANTTTSGTTQDRVTLQCDNFDACTATFLFFSDLSCEDILEQFQLDCSSCGCDFATTTVATTTGDATTLKTTTTGICEPDCLLGHSCDEIQELWQLSDASDRYKCSELEDHYGCSCLNCDCTYDATTTIATTEMADCSAHCIGTINCDEVIEFYSSSLETAVTCDDLESVGIGCDCSGCECQEPVVEALPCTDNCLGFSCDDWDAFLGGGNFSCRAMEAEYGCDCSGCLCTGGHGKCISESYDDVDLCTIGIASKTCDDWQTFEMGGESLTCQYLEFFFGCDCTGCKCEGHPGQGCLDA